MIVFTNIDQRVGIFTTFLPASALDTALHDRLFRGLDRKALDLSISIV